MRVRAGSDDTRRYRIPDVTVVPIRDNPTPIILEPPLVVLEILFPDDRLTDVVKKSADYEAFGIPHIWVVDPESKEEIFESPAFSLSACGVFSACATIRIVQNIGPGGRSVLFAAR